MKKLFEILVPTQYEDTGKPIRTRHHKNWDKYVRKLSKGLTINSISKGQWVYKDNVIEERVIPVRVYCTEIDMKKIVDFTIKHYRQIAVMYYELSNNCHIVYKR